MSANVESMFYVRDVPWHKEGVKLDEPPNTITAIERAGLNWEVSKEPLFIEGGRKVKDHFGIVRCDTSNVLGVVKKNYIPLQNRDAFNVFDPLIENKFLEYETAGVIGEGEIIWILAKVKKNGSFNVNKKDKVNKYLLLSNSHDGKSAVGIKFTPIRVVCQNTLNIALNSGETTRVNHIKNMHTRLDDVMVAVENICDIYSVIEDKFNLMAGYKMTEDMTKEYFNFLYPVIDEEHIKTENQYKNRIINVNIQKQLVNNFQNGFGVKEFGIDGTLWAAYNAVTHQVDHPHKYNLSDNKLLKRIWFGDGEVIKRNAYLKALDYINRAI